MKVSRLVLDTNVLISAIIQPKGKPAAVLAIALERFAILFSGETFAECATRIIRPKFDRLVSREARDELVARLHQDATWVDIDGSLRQVRDPDDDKILETAVAGGADCLVTGDGDLLALRPVGEQGTATTRDDALYQGVAIVRPAEFLALVEIPEG